MTIAELYHHFLNSSGVCTDSRKVKKGSLFFALRGENFNGNQYASGALDGGCEWAVVDDPSLKGKERHILVDNSLKTLQELARHHRRQLGIPVLAITGSNGKTTTKELINAVMSRKFRSYATEGNLNNHIGVPLTLLKLKNEDFAIIEMGANHIGEIHDLCTIAEPDFGLITNIGKAHLEGFGSPEGVIKAKTELYRYLEKKDGLVFVNGNNPVLEKALAETNLHHHSYIEGNKLLCDGYVVPGEVFLNIIIRFTGSSERNISTRLTGEYNFENIMAAAAVGKYFGVREEEIVHAIESYIPSNNRSQFFETDNNSFILDAYNANPASMAGAIKNFLRIAHPQKMMVLGDMLELGEWSDEEHEKILSMIRETGFTNVYLVGEQFEKVSHPYPFPAFRNADNLIEHFKLSPVSNHLILLKASRGIRLEKVLEVL